MEYLFETNEFGISEDSFHLLRSKYNFKTYKNEEISELIIENGRQINNWVFVLLIGLSCILFSIYYSYTLFQFINGGKANTIYIEQIVIPVLPILMGFYCLYASLRVGPTLRLIFVANKKKRFPLSKVKKEKKIEVLISSLKRSKGIEGKLKVNI